MKLPVTVDQVPFEDTIAAAEARIAKAESKRESWRVSGMQEKYLEACSMVDALELQLDALRRAAPRIEDTLGEPERLMKEFSITFNGRHYLYGPYRYDHLAHALGYARMQPGLVPVSQHVEAPSEAQRELMESLSITYQDGVYRLGSYRYDRLTDAIDYARLGVKS